MLLTTKRPGWAVAIVATWLTAVGIGSAGHSVEAGSGPMGLVPFACPHALAAVIALVVAWTTSGDWRKSLTFGASLGVLAGVLAILAYAIFWGLAEPVRIRLGIPRTRYQAFRDENLRIWLPRLAGGSAGYATMPGCIAGVVAGGLVALARRRPRLAAGLAVLLLLAVATLTPALMAAWTALILDRRGEGGRWNGTSMSRDELTMMLGAGSGAVVGALLAGLEARVCRADRRPSTN